MTDIPQEVREAARAEWKHLRDGTFSEAMAVEHLAQLMLAERRAGMERAAEIAEALKHDAESSIASCRPDGLASAALKGNVSAARAIAQAIRSENDGHG